MAAFRAVEERRFRGNTGSNPVGSIRKKSFLGDFMSYRPMMPEKQVQERQKWHDKAYNEMKNRKNLSLTYLGRKFIVPKQVFPPAPMSKLLGKSVLKEVKKTDRVLDMGTGSGVNAILAASKSSDVVAVDINPYVIRCAKLNAKKNKVDSRIKFLNSDLFEEVKGKFDLIIFDPPFRWFTPRDMLERSVADKNYSTLTAFFRSAKKYLNENGRILIFFGTSGDLNYLKFLIKKHEFKKKEMARKELKKMAENMCITLTSCL